MEDIPNVTSDMLRMLLAKLFYSHSAEEVSTTGYENVLLYITQSIDKIMNGDIPVTDLKQ